MDYQEFLKRKSIAHRSSGFEVNLSDLNSHLFDWQKTIVRWALYKGRSAIFADCGLGKTPIQLSWADEVHKKMGQDVLILAPLAVATQTQREGNKFDIDVNICKSQADVQPGINITNYERLHKFDASAFIGIVADESGILKNYAGKIRNQIIDTFINTPYKLCCTATPSPNDYTELGNHSEFLNVMTRPEMLAMFFINDTGDTGKWRMKGHVKDNVFWQWLASWAIMIRKPSDIGFDDAGFDLPDLHIHQHVIPFDGRRQSLFVEHASTLAERREARKESLEGRVNIAAEMINDSDENWIAWCNLNAESKMLANAIDAGVEVTGSDTPAHKESSMLDFADDKIKCLVSKPKIAGLGMNWQNCSHMAFVGLSDSFEQYYQAVRRCWRFGQKKEVHAHIIIGEREGAVAENIRRKEADMAAMFDGMIGHMQLVMKNELSEHRETKTAYEANIEMILPKFLEAA